MGDGVATGLPVLEAGSGDIGGDFRWSGLGIGAGFSAELGTTMCLGLRGLSFLTMPCLPFSGLSQVLSVSLVLAPGLLMDPLRRPRILLLVCFVGLVLKPLTLGTKPVGRFGVELMSPLSLLIGINRSAEL